MFVLSPLVSSGTAFSRKKALSMYVYVCVNSGHCVFKYWESHLSFKTTDWPMCSTNDIHRTHSFRKKKSWDSFHDGFVTMPLASFTCNPMSVNLLEVPTLFSLAYNLVTFNVRSWQYSSCGLARFRVTSHNRVVALGVRWRDDVMLGRRLVGGLQSLVQLDNN
jgi:hypothetical protein